MLTRSNLKMMVNRRKRRQAARALVFLAVAFVFAALLAGCGDSAKESGPPDAARAPETTQAGAKEPPPAKPGGEGRAPVVVRLSGSSGTVFAGSYGNLDKSTYAEGVLEDKPIEYKVEVRDSGFDVVNASFVKPRPDEGSLIVEIIVDGEVVTQIDSEAQYGALNLSWGFGG